MSPFVHETNSHAPDPTATDVPKPDLPLLESQIIEEKLSAKNDISATNGVLRLNLTVSGSSTSTLVIGPQLPFVKLGLDLLNAFSTVYFTSFASIAVPS